MEISKCCMGLVPQEEPCRILMLSNTPLESLTMLGTTEIVDCVNIFDTVNQFGVVYFVCKVGTSFMLFVRDSDCETMIEKINGNIIGNNIVTLVELNNTDLSGTAETIENTAGNDGESIKAQQDPTENQTENEDRNETSSSKTAMDMLILVMGFLAVSSLTGVIITLVKIYN